MALVVEARSLSSLTTLASDPPIYPHNPSQLPHGPLSLYIVRVPGSKDVFLTPLKPRDKVVNAQDVQSSLYFLHVDEVEDAMQGSIDMEPPFMPSIQETGQSGHNSAYVPRKPLPTPPMSPVDTSEQAFGHSKPAWAADVPKRKPVTNRVGGNAQQLDLPQIPPRPSHRTMNSLDGSHGGPDYAARRPLTQIATQGPSMDHYYESHYANDARSGNRSRADSDISRADGPATLSLTLIRRDPTSGAQWNVAKIYDPPVQEVSSESLVDSGVYRAKRSGAPLFVDISNPGYSKFLHHDQARPVSRSSAESRSVEIDRPADGVFRRRLWMDGSKFADHAYTHRKQSSIDRRSGEMRSSFHLDPQDFRVSPRAVVDRRTKGYSFRSPWGGKCEFATGVSGRALKCRYHPESSNGAMANVSELRFNLPAAGGFVATPGTTDSTDPSTKRSSRFLRPNFHRHPSSDPPFLDADIPDELPNYFDERGNIDYSLGKERAGGGFHGKRAKLGKLVVEDMGLKMLDLTVATNMALWWRAYERA